MKHPCFALLLFLFILPLTRIEGVEARSADIPATTSIDLGGGVKISFAKIPTGSFMMGSPSGERGREPDEGPQHQVTISGFQMQTSEVTEEQYRAVMGVNPSHFQHAVSQKQPVNMISWWDAIRFCNTLSETQGLTACYQNASNRTLIVDSDWISCNWTSNGFRLPTEAEWEYACRGGADASYDWGNSNDEDSFIYRANSEVSYVMKYQAEDLKPDIAGHGPWNVGAKRANGFGLYDMLGNVWEWCWDWYGSYSSASQNDPRGPVDGVHRVFRGGSFFCPRETCRPARRNGPGCSLSGKWYAMGFRLARSGY
ncbi:MAG: SUMF1/EgtB/PvdO family nonheme iron enzyme [Candidatus Riflebacteria bacterium]|nr:SUMF1/EgtB/PvdO family nonheme iron enzyme [Candidatus Riflebacteria bacterium]